MATEEKTVSTEPTAELTDESSNDCSKEVEVPLDKAAEETVVSDQLTDREVGEQDKSDEVKVEEAEEGFETPEEGEGETTTDEVKLDDDENIENPAYIPKTGKYYMHDSREDTEVAREEKKSRADGMWSRDRYDERYQQPRSRKQMIEKYGFDIRLGETKEIAEDNEKRMREAGIDLENEETEKVDKREMGKQRYVPSERKEPRRLQRRDENPAKSGYKEEKNEEDDIRPAARRDARKKDGNRGYLTRGEGEETTNRGGQGGREGREGTTWRGDRGRGAPNRQFNRTFNNSNRNSAKDENRDRGAPKRYSTQRGEQGPAPAVINDNHSIVYFDPSHQSPGVPVRREKVPLEIVRPS